MELGKRLVRISMRHLGMRLRAVSVIRAETGCLDPNQERLLESSLRERKGVAVLFLQNNPSVTFMENRKEKPPWIKTQGIENGAGECREQD